MWLVLTIADVKCIVAQELVEAYTAVKLVLGEEVMVTDANASR